MPFEKIEKADSHVGFFCWKLIVASISACSNVDALCYNFSVYITLRMMA
tara:strand:+ start:238849 stop:238995 length:147 start_codon:yes stop_codon:yes gene_type:complete